MIHEAFYASKRSRVLIWGWVNFRVDGRTHLRAFLLLVFHFDGAYTFCLLVLLYGFNAMIASLPIGLHVAISLYMMIRFGLLAHATCFTVRFMTSTLHLTLYPDCWYFGCGMVAMVIVVGISFYGFRVAVGRPTSLGFKSWLVRKSFRYCPS